MYEELVSDLRKGYTDRLKEAADAIEELNQKIESLESEREISPEAEYAIDKHADNLISHMDELIKGLKSKPRWIPVTEGLPKQDDELDAICWISDGPGTEGYCITAFYNRSEQKWVPDAEWVDPNKVTHWMRRPEPPKEG